MEVRLARAALLTFDEARENKIKLLLLYWSVTSPVENPLAWGSRWGHGEMAEKRVRSERKLLLCAGDGSAKGGPSELVWRAFLCRSGPCCFRFSRPKRRTNPFPAATIDRVASVLRDVLIT